MESAWVRVYLASSVSKYNDLASIELALCDQITCLRHGNALA